MPKYNKLGSNITQAIEMLLEEHSIQYLKVYYRIKEEKSFIEKIDRKKYINPFDQIEDICGVRIICYYRSDIDKVCKIINEEFEVLDSQDKEEKLNPDQFGYRSHHFIIKIKDEWLCTPNYKGLANLKAEIQIRTNLMHTWAEIEHELGYKKEEDIPFEFRRKFSRISAKLEEADEQFEELKQGINIYKNNIIAQTNEHGWNVSPNKDELNVDKLQVFLDLFFEDRPKAGQTGLSELLKELKTLKIDIPQLIDLLEQCNHVLIDLEQEESSYYGEPVTWTQAGVVRTILLLTVDEYMEFNSPPYEIRSIIEHYKNKVKNI